MRKDAEGTRFEQFGDGTDVVLVHGLGLNLDMWRDLVTGLGAAYRVSSYDLIGHGASRRPAAPLAMTDFVEQLERLVDSLSLGRFALIGFSLGGLIAQAFTIAHPRRVAALGVLHSAFDRNEQERAAIRARVELAQAGGPRATVEAALERWFTAGFATRRPDVVDQVRRWVVANDPAAFAWSYRVLAEADAPLAGRLREIGCPALVMTGEEDHGNSPDMARRMAASMQNAQCRILPGLRHMAAVENPQAVHGPLRSFLDGSGAWTTR